MRNIRKQLKQEDNELLMLRLVWSAISMEDYTNYLQNSIHEKREPLDYMPATFRLTSYVDNLTAKN